MRDQLRTWIDSKADWPILTTSIARNGSTMVTACRIAASPATSTGASR
jgi:hypothetical protein